jgi:hypothetical protein
MSAVEKKGRFTHRRLIHSRMAGERDLRITPQPDVDHVGPLPMYLSVSPSLLLNLGTYICIDGQATGLPLHMIHANTIHINNIVCLFLHGLRLVAFLCACFRLIL